MKITMSTAEELTLDVLHAGLVPSLISSPGIGKSALAKSIAKKNGLKLIDVRLSQLDPADLNGFPFIMKDAAPVRAGYVPMDLFPVEGDEIPEGYKGWLVLLDEFNSAPLSVQAAAYKVILDRMIGMYKMHKCCAVITAGNLSTDKAIVNRIGTAMQSRLVWLEIKVCDKAWANWANNNDIDHRVKSFIQFKPDALHKFNPNHTEHTFPCPRTWEFMSKLIKPMKNIEVSKMPLLSGTVGEGTGREFFAYSKIYRKIPTIQEIIKNPTKVKLENEPSLQYALSGLVSHHMTATNADALMAFVRRLGIDFQVIILRAAVAKDTSIMNVPGVKNWIQHNSKEMQ